MFPKARPTLERGDGWVADVDLVAEFDPSVGRDLGIAGATPLLFWDKVELGNHDWWTLSGGDKSMRSCDARSSRSASVRLAPRNSTSSSWRG